MENTEYGIQVRRFANDENGNTVYVRWDNVPNDCITENIRDKLFKELDAQLIGLKMQAKIDPIRVGSRWKCGATLGETSGGSTGFYASTYDTPHEAIYEAVARLRTYVNGIATARFLDEIRSQAAAAGLVIEVEYFGGIEEDDLIDKIAIFYGNGVPALTGKLNPLESDDSGDYEPGPLIEAVELQDPLWQSKVMDTIRLYEARVELDKFAVKFPDIKLRLSLDGCAFEVPYLYREGFISKQIKREFGKRDHTYTNEDIYNIARTLGYIPLTQNNLRDLFDTIVEIRADQNPDNIPEDTDTVDDDADQP